MDFGRWIREFRQLHEQAKGGQLDAAGVKIHQAGRDELARAMLAAGFGVYAIWKRARRE